MSPNNLCEADKILPDGNVHFQINNCPGNYDIFRYIPGKSFSKTRNRTINNIDRYIYMAHDDKCLVFQNPV